MRSSNITMLQTVAEGLGKLNNEMVFIGGSVIELYASDSAASENPRVPESKAQVTDLRQRASGRHMVILTDQIETKTIF